MKPAELIILNKKMDIQIKERLPLMLVVIGTNDTGKSTFTKELVLKETKKKDSNVLIVASDDIEWNFLPSVHPAYNWEIEENVKARKTIYEKGLLRTILEKFSSGMLIFDDCSAYFTSTRKMDLRALLIRRRQKMIDIVMVANGFTNAPPEAFIYASHYVLFKTIDNIDKRKNVIYDFPKIKEAQQRINKIAETNPHYYEIIEV
jgi:molybdopterin-guanine dinucleotide biosynthesis protein